MLANHVWSLTDVPSPTARGAPPSESGTEEMIAEGPTTPGRWRINNTFLQPFVTYAFPTHTTVFLNSETQYNWTTRQWTIPIAAGVNQLVRVGGRSFSWGERSATGSSGRPAARPGACVFRRHGCCRRGGSLHAASARRRGGTAAASLVQKRFLWRLLIVASAASRFIKHPISASAKPAPRRQDGRDVEFWRSAQPCAAQSETTWPRNSWSLRSARR